MHIAKPSERQPTYEASFFDFEKNPCWHKTHPIHIKRQSSCRASTTRKFLNAEYHEVLGIIWFQSHIDIRRPSEASKDPSATASRQIFHELWVFGGKKNSWCCVQSPNLALATTYASIQNQRARASPERKTTIKWIRIHCWWSFYIIHDRELAL